MRATQRFLVTIAACLAMLAPACALTADQMYPYGPAQGDLTEPPNDDSFIQANVHVNFPFFGETFNTLFVDNNGILSFGQGFGTYTPSPFPLASRIKVVAGFWADVITYGGGDGGNVYYREVIDGPLLDVATTQIRLYFPDYSTFRASWLFVATWSNVTCYGCSGCVRPTDTFQIILVTDGSLSFAIYQYLNIQWTTGTASGGNRCTGLQGTPAQVGFDAGDGINFFAIPESRTPAVVNVGQLSNLNPAMPGRYIFQINAQQINNIPTYTMETCTAVTDPHFQTFDNAYYSPMPPVNGLFLAAAPTILRNNTRPWSVWFSTTYWYSTPYTCIDYVQVNIEGQTIAMGMNGLLQINGVDTVAPWYYPNQVEHSVSVTQFGSTGHLLTTTIEMLRVSFTGDYDYKMVIQLPYELFYDGMTGYCGDMNNDPNNDPQCNDGYDRDINNCYPWPWQPSSITTVSPINNPTQNTWDPDTTWNPSTENPWNTDTTQNPWIPTTTAARPKCTPQEEAAIEEVCNDIIDPYGKFGICVTNASLVADMFYESCIYDLCAMGGQNYTDVICNYLASYAAQCMQALPSIIIKWRSESFCPPSCPANSVYSDCASSCPATCGNPQAPLSCPLPCTGACTCNANYVLEKGVCIPTASCGCTDTDGNYHAQGDRWVTPNCTERCSCNQGSISCQGMMPCGTNAYCNVQNGARDCFCNAGYTGNPFVSCSLVDYCATMPCQNGASCTNVLGGYICQCPSGFTGVNCNNIIDHCYPNPCSNGGTCINNQNGYSCQCPPGVVGTNCQSETDYCSSAPCQHGGTCHSVGGDFTCECPYGYTGLVCERHIYTTQQLMTTTREALTTTNQNNPTTYTPISPCTQNPNPCSNGGTCINSRNGYSCQCPPGFVGTNCQLPYVPDFCSSQPCQHGGTCYAVGQDFACTCPPGYSGLVCDFPIPSPCTPNPCPALQTCDVRGNSYTCQCIGNCTFSCRGRPNGDYADRTHPCAPYFFACSNEVVYQMPCPPGLYFYEGIDKCLFREEVPGCH